MDSSGEASREVVNGGAGPRVSTIGMEDIERLLQRSLSNQMAVIEGRFEAQIERAVETLRAELRTPLVTPLRQQRVQQTSSGFDGESRRRRLDEATGEVYVSDSFGIPSGAARGSRRDSVSGQRRPEGRSGELNESGSEDQLSDSDEGDMSGDRRYSTLRNVIAPREFQAKPVVSITQEPYKGSRLEQLSVFNALRFIDDINRYKALLHCGA